MKKYLKLLLLLIIFPVAIKAAEINVSLSCPEGAALNSEINCIISVDTQVKFTGLSGKYDSVIANAEVTPKISNTGNKDLENIINKVNLKIEAKCGWSLSQMLMFK